MTHLKSTNYLVYFIPLLDRGRNMSYIKKILHILSAALHRRDHTVTDCNKLMAITIWNWL